MSDEIAPDRFALVAHLKGDLSAAQLNYAIKKAIGRHPQLVENLLKDIPSDSAIFPLHILEQTNNIDWQIAVKNELSQPFLRQNGEMVRFIWIKTVQNHDSMLLISFNHSIADGLFGTYLLRDILAVLKRPDVELSQIPASDDFGRLLAYSLPHKMWVLLKVGIFLSLFKILSIVTSFRKRKFTEANQHSEENEKIALSSIFWTLDESLTTAFITKCRAENTTVYAALCIAFANAFIHRSGYCAEELCHKVATPVSIRRYFSPSRQEVFGMFSITLELSLPSLHSQEDFWDAARLMKRTLDKETRIDKVLPLMWTLKSITAKTTDEMALEDMVEKSKIGYDFVITNLGRLDIPTQYEHLTLEAIYGPLVYPGRPYEKIVGVSTIGKHMCFCLVANEFAMNQNTMMNIQQEAVECIKQAVK